MRHSCNSSATMEKTFSATISLFTLLLLSFLWGCKKDGTADNTTPTDLIIPPTAYTFVTPPGFPPPYFSSFNPMTVEGVALGKSLYSDPILSSNGMSCSSCHQKANSFSSAIYNAPNGFRMSVLPHVNLAFKTICNWDGSVTVMDSLCMADFEPSIFNTHEADLFSRLKSHPYYPSMFKAAFGIPNIDSLNFHDLKLKICFAITQYMRSLVSANSKYDAYRVFKRPMTTSELNGMQIFFSEKGDCFHCHPDPLFTDNDFHNNGLTDVFTGFDQGRFMVTAKSTDLGKFRTPTLRNVTLTAPYMHDGRFNTLEEVIDFYTSAVKTSATLDPIMTKRLNNRTMNLTAEEKQELIDFLKTLTDDSFVK